MNASKTAVKGPPTVPGGVPPTGIPYSNFGGFISTSGGHRFYYDNPEGFEYLPGDIGHALANICRFAGQGRWWSVAQHSLLVSDLAEPRDKLRAILHDASEAFMVDVPGPLKEMVFMAGYKLLEARVLNAIHSQFGLPRDNEAEQRVKQIDSGVRPLEARMIGLEWPWPDVSAGMRIPTWIQKLERNDAAEEFEKRVYWYREA